MVLFPMLYHIFQSFCLAGGRPMEEVKTVLNLSLGRVASHFKDLWF